MGKHPVGVNPPVDDREEGPGSQSLASHRMARRAEAGGYLNPELRCSLCPWTTSTGIFAL